MAGVFLGEYKHNLTSGKRLALPRKIRASITGDEVVLAKGTENCINGFDKATWEEAGKQYLAIPLYEEKGRQIRRQMFAGAQVVSIDVQGRVVLPNVLMKWAKIKAEMVVIGAGDHFEIWDSKSWQAYLEETEGEDD
jgi:MraZ protein